MQVDWKKWKPRIFWLLVTPAILVLLFPVGLFVAIFLYSPMNPLNEWMFNRDLPEYDRIVNDVKSGKVANLPNKLQGYRPAQMPGRATAIEVARCNNGTAIVVFVIAGSAVGHWGYMYDDCDIPTSSPRHNKAGFSAVPLQGNWYEWSG